MDLTDLKILLPLLERHGMKPKKRLGQHFLCSPKVVQSILTAAQTGKGILEIGPGPGVLTSPLTENFEKVFVVEIDSAVIPILEETAPKAHLIQHDIITLDLEPILLSLPQPRVIVSNMPYNLTGPLLFKINSVRHLITKAVLMMQKEVGERILAPPGNSDLGAISVNLQTFFDIKKICDVPKGAFYPVPKVQSTVLSFTPKMTELSDKDSQEFVKFVRACFLHPRKTLLNNLNSITNEGRKILNDLNLVDTIRPHQISLDQWQNLYKQYRLQIFQN